MKQHFDSNLVFFLTGTLRKQISSLNVCRHHPNLKSLSRAIFTPLLMGGTPAASCREGQTAPAVTCMLFIPKVEFSATFRHVRPSRSWRFAQPKVGLCGWSWVVTTAAALGQLLVLRAYLGCPSGQLVQQETTEPLLQLGMAIS